MFIAVTRIEKLPREARDRMLAAFKRGAPDMKQCSGFLGFELWTNEDTLEAVSRWESREAMEQYTKSSVFAAHHGPPGGGGAMPGQISFYDAEIVV